jgi:hypothetical protein
MTSSTLIELLLGLALIAYIGSKQLTWRPVDPARVWKLPLILGAIGVVSMARQGGPVRSVDVVILGLSFAFALASGVVMGRITLFRQSPADPRLVESRTGLLGIGIWLCLVAVRVVLDVEGRTDTSRTGPRRRLEPATLPDLKEW